MCVCIYVLLSMCLSIYLSMFMCISDSLSLSLSLSVPLSLSLSISLLAGFIVDGMMRNEVPELPGTLATWPALKGTKVARASASLLRSKAVQDGPLHCRAFRARRSTASGSGSSNSILEFCSQDKVSRAWGDRGCLRQHSDTTPFLKNYNHWTWCWNTQ